MGLANVGSPGLKHDNPDLFDRSQWSPPGRVKSIYVNYRILMAVFFISGIIAQVVNSRMGGKWFIYMTNQGILFLTIHYTLEAALVTRRYFSEKLFDDQSQTYHNSGTISLVYKISWALGSCFFTIALFITFVYWTFLHKYVVEGGLMKNELAEILNVFLHAINSVSCLIDIWVSARPWRLMHFYFSIIFGLYYASFSVIYWASGGTGICTAQPDGTEHCDRYIYPILDWEDHPGVAAGFISAGLFFCPLVHSFWVGLSRLRRIIYVKMLPKEFSTSPIPNKVV